MQAAISVSVTCALNKTSSAKGTGADCLVFNSTKNIADKELHMAASFVRSDNLSNMNIYLFIQTKPLPPRLNKNNTLKNGYNARKSHIS